MRPFYNKVLDFPHCEGSWVAPLFDQIAENLSKLAILADDQAYPESVRYDSTTSYQYLACEILQQKVLAKIRSLEPTVNDKFMASFPIALHLIRLLFKYKNYKGCVPIF
jgi:hypothetical protein